MSLVTDIRTAGTAAVDQLTDVVGRAAAPGQAVLDRVRDERRSLEAKVDGPDLRRPLLAWIGATDYALSRLAELPKRARSVGATGHGVEDLGKQLANAYGELVDRGDRTVSRLRREPAVRRVEARAEQLLDRVDEAVVAVAGSATEQVRRADQVTGEAADEVATKLEETERRASRTVRHRARDAVDRETPPVRRTRSGATTRTTTGTTSKRTTSAAGTTGARKPASRTRARSR